MSGKTGNVVKIPSVYIIHYCNECPMANVANDKGKGVNIYCTALQKRVHEGLTWNLGFIHRAKEEDKYPDGLDYIPDECPLMKDPAQYGTLEIGEKSCASSH